MKTTNWRTDVAADEHEIGPDDLEAVLANMDEAGEEDFDLGEAWEGDFDPSEDDPE